MAEIVNLRIARKRRMRAEAETAAAANRTAHGIVKTARIAAANEEARRARLLAGARRDPSD